MAFAWIPDIAGFLRPVQRGQGMRLYGLSSGSVGLKAAANAGGVDFTLPAADGTPGQFLQTDGAGNLSLATPITAISTTNKQGSAILAGQCCAMHSSGVGVVLANATDNTLNGIGLATVQINTNFAGSVQTQGLITLSDWTNAIGSTSLVARAVYFLDSTSGQITNTPTTIVGHVLQKIGEAVGPQTLMIRTAPPIQL